MSYPAYAETKPSGVDWLGEVPKGWDVKRTRYVCKLNPPKSEISGLPHETSVSFLPMEKVGTEGEIALDENRAIEDVLQGFTYFRDGDIITAKITPCFENGKGAIVSHLTNGIGFGSTEFHVLRPYLQNNPHFIYYLTKSHSFRSWGIASMYGAGGQKRVPEDFIEDFRVAFPLLPEQQKIAAFLDRKTAELDAVLGLKERQLELLAEKRQALISQAVTHGLDPTAPLKPSGIDWLGDVPEQWELTRMRYITSSLQTGPFGSQLHSEEYIDDGIPIVNPANIEAGRIVPNMRCTIDQDTFSRLERHALREGDIVFGRRGEMGRCALVTEQEQGWLCGTGSLRMRFYPANCYPAYMSLQLSLDGIRDWLTLESVGSTMDNLNTEILARIPIGLPPLPEQKAIVAYLDRETARMDRIAQAIRAQIGKVREYRQALISAAVTGKIDVREEAQGFQGEKPND